MHDAYACASSPVTRERVVGRRVGRHLSQQTQNRRRTSRVDRRLCSRIVSYSLRCEERPATATLGSATRGVRVCGDSSAGIRSKHEKHSFERAVNDVMNGSVYHRFWVLVCGSRHYSGRDLPSAAGLCRAGDHTVRGRSASLEPARAY